jgi:hypothetical protein
MVSKDTKDIESLDNLRKDLDYEEVLSTNRSDLLLSNNDNILMLVGKKRKESKDRFGLRGCLPF